MGISLNRTGVKVWRRCRSGVVGLERGLSRTLTELQNQELVEALWKGEPQRVIAPYTKTHWSLLEHPSSAGTVKTGVNLRGPPRKAKYT